MPRAQIVVGLGFGDEGKGSWVDHLVRTQGARFVIRCNGGAQALHHVVTPDGREHGFAQFGSGSFSPDVQTVLSRFMLIEPEAMMKEGALLEGRGVPNPLARVLVSRSAPLIPPCNRIFNRMQEVFRGSSRHGSCGFGIGVTQHDVDTLGGEALYVRDVVDGTFRRKLDSLTARRLEEAAAYRNCATEALLDQLNGIDHEYYENLFSRWASQVQIVSDEELRRLVQGRDLIFEGAQGVLLDQYVGFFPYCTRSTCTFENAEILLREWEFSGVVERIGLLRGYGTRHGAGPFVTEAPELPVPPCHNRKGPWQGEFRVGWFDAVAARYALRCVGGVHQLAITNLDRLNGIPALKVAVRYEGDERFVNDGELARVPVNYPLLAERSKCLWSVTPHYESFDGWQDPADDPALKRYLEGLERVLQHRISAYSLSAGPDKVYR